MVLVKVSSPFHDASTGERTCPNGYVGGGSTFERPLNLGMGTHI